ncbi:MAG: ethanolamine ammonia-lyase subunit EutC, partial [Planctomycetia bacterium]|nr:ethanolamine ammonia-lyase subunit EutC [Planctomycetia bacterium]
LLALRQDHAAALDAVHAELDLERDLGRGFVADWSLTEGATRARDKAEYLMRPDLGRLLDEVGRAELARSCPPAADLQVAIGDGLSALAVVAQAPALLPLLADEVRRRGWSFGRPFFVRRCRVGVLNDLGDLLRPKVLVLLIGERPGLATAESLSAYMAWRPHAGQTDADRNLISNIHARGVSAADAARRIAGLAAQMMVAEASGVAIKEELPATTQLPDSAGDG